VPVAPSTVEAFGRTPRALTVGEMPGICQKFAEAAVRVKKAGFDLVELHGGTGYLLAEFLSPRTNRRDDAYGGSIENRCRLPLEVISAVKAAVGDFPVGYRFLAEEWLPDGLSLAEACEAAKVLDGAGLAYLSVMGGTYESFGLPEVRECSEKPGYMVELAAAVKKAVKTPVIAAGRIDTGALGEEIIADGRADLIGLARVLWADPEWPVKVREGREAEIIRCDCDGACQNLVATGRAALCSRWPKDKYQDWKRRLSQEAAGE
jgi:2,4-dienoyl-CoA reductase (NADPH2)